MKEMPRRAEVHHGIARIPGSTYRLQLNSEFTFADALAITDYLDQLGLTDCYASPILAACPGSTHGYDVCDCTQINPQAGGRQHFERWSDRLRELGMGLLLDVVPNHMSASLSNPWWRDVLQHGQNSEFASWFDIDWHSPDERLHGKVLLPILEQPYWRVLEAGKLRIVFDDDRLVLAYSGQTFPLSPESCAPLQHELLEICRQEARATESLEDLNALGALAARLNPGNSLSEPEYRGNLSQVAAPPVERPRTWPVLKRALRRFNGTVGAAESFDSLHALLEQQHYRLAWWRLGNEAVNYRRFFDVTELVALRMELPEVFQATHELVVRLLQEGQVTCLRVDHPDGLWDPCQYFQRLQQAFRMADAHKASETGQRAGLYVVAEKILSGSETLPSDWPVAGTTGYDFLNQLNGLFVSSSNRAALDGVYLEFAGPAPEFCALVYDAKLKILQTSMRADLRALIRQLRTLSGRTRYGQDFSPVEIGEALGATIAAFPVYRTYTTETSETPSATDVAVVEEAIRAAVLANPSVDPQIFEFIKDLLLLRPPTDMDGAELEASREFVMRFQQLTGPVMAKGLEDTAFYNYNRLISLNEVGGAPDRFGTDLASFHASNERRAEHWPHSLLATATHDTKRGEDLRARVNVLSEIPEEWRQAVLKWSRLNADKKTEVEGRPAPDSNDEYFLYQTLVGAWINEAENGSGSEGFRARISQYMLKAFREAKAHTSWTDPNLPYEQATQRFIEQILTHSAANTFLDDFMLFHRNIAVFGLFNSLAQIVLKMTCPGVPDFYQGTELWDYSLVDPDNRRPVDYEVRRALLDDLKQKIDSAQNEVGVLVRLLLKNHQTGQIKLYVIWRILQLRSRRRQLFERGQYIPMTAVGSKQDHVCAFTRSTSDDSVITVAGRLMLSLGRGARRGALEPDAWQETVLPVEGSKPGDRFRDVLTQQVVAVRADGSGLSVADVLSTLPVAVLEKS